MRLCTARGVGEAKICEYVLDVINVWPLMLLYIC